MTTMFIATARARRKTRVESISAMTMIMLTIEVPRMVSSRSAKISAGIAISTSTMRDSTWSSQPPTAAARSPSTEPTAKASAVVRNAMPTVLRAP